VPPTGVWAGTGVSIGASVGVGVGEGLGVGVRTGTTMLPAGGVGVGPMGPDVAAVGEAVGAEVGAEVEGAGDGVGEVPELGLAVGVVGALPGLAVTTG